MSAAAIIPAGADDRWPAGRPAAPGSAFDWRNWTLQCDWGALVLSSKLTKVQTERIERARTAGDTSGTIARLSKRADAMKDSNAGYWHGEPKSRSMVSIENREAGQRSTDKRAAIRKGGI